MTGRIFDKLTPLQRRFFEELGIHCDEDIPKSFFEIIKPYDKVFSTAESYVLGDYNRCQNGVVRVPIRDVVGTNYSGYAGKTWIDAFMSLAKGEENLSRYFGNPSYYDNLRNPGNGYIGGLAPKNGEYYIFDGAGGGNNRMIIMKIKYLALASRYGETKDLIEQFSFYSNVRISPREDIANSIYFIEFPTGNFPASGYLVQISNVSDDGVVLYNIVVGPFLNRKVVLKGITGEELLGIDVEHLDDGVKNGLTK